MREGECTFCEEEGNLYHIRGREACLKCQLEFLWDYVEGTRRMVEQGGIVYGPQSAGFPDEKVMELTDEEYDALPLSIRQHLRKMEEG